MNKTITINLDDNANVYCEKNNILSNDTLRDFMRAMCNEDSYQLNHMIAAICSKYQVNVHVVDHSKEVSEQAAYAKQQYGIGGCAGTMQDVAGPYKR